MCKQVRQYGVDIDESLGTDGIVTGGRLHGQLLQWEEVPKVVARERSSGKIIVTANGAFDLLHAGHVKFLQEAREQGDALFVGLNSDASVRANKGAGRPINNEMARADVLLSLRCVDYVVIFKEATPIRFIELAGPQVHVNGAEYGEQCVEADTVSRLNARLHLVPRDIAMSSSQVITRIRALAMGVKQR